MGLIETKFQLERQLRELMALHGNIQQSHNMIRYYSTFDEEVPVAEMDISLGYMALSAENLKKQINTLEQSEAYKKEYAERYAVPAYEETEPTKEPSLE